MSSVQSDPPIQYVGVIRFGFPCSPPSTEFALYRLFQLVCVCVAMRTYTCYRFSSLRMQYFTTKSNICSIVSEQLIELSLVIIGLLYKALLHCVTPHNNKH